MWRFAGLILGAIFCAALALGIAGCNATATPHREGPVIVAPWPQVDDQCRAQPDLPWCAELEEPDDPPTPPLATWDRRKT